MVSRSLRFVPVALVLALASAACGDPSPPTAIAARRSQLGSSVPNAEISGAPEDPDTLFLLLGSEGRSCADPFIEVLGKDIECADYWRVTIAVPPPIAKPGKVELASPDIVNAFLRVIPQGSAGCLVEGDKFTVGTLELTSVDKAQVAFRIQGAADPGVSMGEGVAPLDVDGEYTAALCP